MNSVPKLNSGKISTPRPPRRGDRRAISLHKAPTSTRTGTVNDEALDFQGLREREIDRAREMTERVILSAANKPELTPSRQEQILAELKKQDPETIKRIYELLRCHGKIAKPFPNLKEPNSDRRTKRHIQYINHLSPIINQYIDSLPSRLFCDMGCGDGVITYGSLRQFIELKGEAHIECVDICDYLSPRIKESVCFFRESALNYLQEAPDNFFGGMMENVALHHLPSKSAYKRVIEEMFRVTKPGGKLFITETVHNNWPEHLRNAVLDILLNNQTSQEIGGKGIPVPIQFLSAEELRLIITENGGKILQEVPMQPTEADPKLHITFVVGVQEEVKP